MKIIDTISGIRKRCEEIRVSGKTIAFVPTMGFFHEGHLELMRVGRQRADVLVISIFVNPTQFGPNEDLEAYPRDMDGDLDKAKEVGVDLAFIPSGEEIYPKGFKTKIVVEKITHHLCGISRPQFFTGVATVVTKLFNIINPHIAIFGQKDFQQLAVIHRMVEDLNMDIDIVGVPIVRDNDGLAMSSRNHYLKPNERKSALSLKKSIELAEKMVQEGEREVDKILSATKTLIKAHNFTEIDYLTICDPMTMEDFDRIEGKSLFALAVKVGKTRLIDNCILNIHK